MSAAPEYCVRAAQDVVERLLTELEDSPNDELVGDLTLVDELLQSSLERW